VILEMIAMGIAIGALSQQIWHVRKFANKKELPVAASTADREQEQVGFYVAD
jgi:hypothetical protein